jgi:predicted permease
MMSDIRFALRSLSKSKLFTAVAVTSLALGIGTSTAVFSVVNAIAFRPLPYAEPARLVDVHEWSATKLCAGCGVGASLEIFHEWRRDARSFVAMGAYNERPFNVSGTETAERIGGAVVSAKTFDVLGVQPAMGRAFEESDDRPDATPVVVLSDALWKRRYAADRRVVGQTIRVNGVEHTVIGVMPPAFKFPEFAELWLPLEPNARGGARDRRELGVVARLRADVTLERADAEMRRIARSVEERFPDTHKEWTARATWLRDEMAGTEALLYGVMLGAVGFVLLIVCANLAGLLLARGAARRKEIAIRLALGATRPQIVRHLLVESVVLALTGGALGLLVALWVVDIAVASIRSQVPFWIQFGIDGTAFAFCAVLSLVTGLLFGLLPALRASRPDVHTALKDSAGGLAGGADRSHLRALFVVFELAMSIVLLAGAGVLFKNFLRISQPERGYDRTNLLTSRLEFLDSRYREAAQLNDAFARLVERTARIPGASSVALDRVGFIAGFGASDQQIRAEGVAAVPAGASPRFYRAVTPDYRRTMRLPLLSGRDFNAQDRAGAPAVALINRRMGEQLWPGASPIGRRIKLGAADSLPWVTVVGVVGDIDFSRGFSPNYAYVPLAQSPGSEVTLYVRAPGDPLALAPAVRAEVRAVDPDLPVLNLRTLEQEQHAQYWPYEMYALFMSGFAVLAILLAAIGVYGVIAYNAAQRTREIGIRIALGAEARHVIAMIGAQGGRLVLLGVVLGIGGSMLLLRVMGSLLIGASPIDPPVFAGVSVLLALVALVATYLPARRAARVDPLVALRAD